jgi:hypothetical protein
MARNASDEANNAILCAKNRLPATTSSSLHNTFYPGMHWNVKMQATTTYQKKALMNHYFDSLFLHATLATIKEYW